MYAITFLTILELLLNQQPGLHSEVEDFCLIQTHKRAYAKAIAELLRERGDNAVIRGLLYVNRTLVRE